MGPIAAVARQSFLRLKRHIILAGLTFIVMIARNKNTKKYERHAETLRKKVLKWEWEYIRCRDHYVTPSYVSYKVMLIL